MKLVGKTVGAMLIAGSAMLASTAPAQARTYVQVGIGTGYYGDGYYRTGYRDGYRGYRGYDRWDRRDYRRHHRYNRHYRNDWRGYRDQCWTQWRYDPYYGRREKVRYCR